jgi:hypothetical protein
MDMARWKVWCISCKKLSVIAPNKVKAVSIGRKHRQTTSCDWGLEIGTNILIVKENSKKIMGCPK